MKWLAYVWTSSIWTMSGTAAGWWLAVRGARPLLPAPVAPEVVPSGRSLASFPAPPLAESDSWVLLGPQALHLAYGALGGFLILTAAVALGRRERTGLFEADPRFADPAFGTATEFKRLDVDVRDLQNLLDERTNVLINRIGELRSDVVAGFAGLEMQGTVINEKLGSLEMQGAVINEKLEMQGAVINEKLNALWRLACAPDVVQILDGSASPTSLGGPLEVLSGPAASEGARSLWPKIVDIGIALAFAPFASNLR